MRAPTLLRWAYHSPTQCRKDPQFKGHERALEGGTSLKSTLALVEEFRRSNATTPLVLMGYANPLERQGYAFVADACADAGIDGLITVDLPPEEVSAMNAELQRRELDNIF